MKVLIKSMITGLDFEKEIEGPDDICESMSFYSSDEFRQHILEELWDFYADIVSSCPVIPRGTFDEEEIKALICNHTKEIINHNQDKWQIRCTWVDDEDQVAQCDAISIGGLLSDLLEDDSCRGDFDAHSGRYVEACLYEFVKKGEWHIEEGCIWFGLEKPERPWVINSDTKPENLSFWFEVDDWNIMKCLGNFSDIFLTWYIGECGYWAPEMDEILKICPVCFSENDTVESILKKVNVFYILQ